MMVNSHHISIYFINLVLAKLDGNLEDDGRLLQAQLCSSPIIVALSNVLCFLEQINTAYGKVYGKQSLIGDWIFSIAITKMV